ncbi:MAG: hypothetical protein AB7O97_18245 [Planctomycetota bacterium]
MLARLALFALCGAASAQTFELRSPRPILGYLHLQTKGGAAGGPALAHDGRLWDFDGAGFAPGRALPFPATRPFPKCLYDAARDEQVVLSPQQSDGPVETWVRAGDALVFRAMGPASLGRSTFGYDPVRRGLVAVSNAALPPITEHFWNGANWTLLPAPPAQRGTVMAMAPDLARNRLVALCAQGAPVTTEVWEHDGTSWQLMPASTPMPPPSPELQWDPRTSSVMLFGDGTVPSGTDTWLWNGATWTRVATPTTPDGSANRLYLARDPVHDTLRVMTSGPVEWLWTGSDWQEVDRRGALRSHGQGYHPLFQELVRYDERGDHQGRGASWRFIPGPTPPITVEPMAHDLFRDTMVKFHVPFAAAPVVETWLRSPSGTWSQVATAIQPGPRTAHALVSSPQTGQVVLFGGNWNGQLNDTWTWDGQWTDVTAAQTQSPPGGVAVGGVGPGLQRPVVVSGGELWEWSGSWQLLSAAVPIPIPLAAAVRSDGSAALVGQDLNGNPIAHAFRTGAWSPLAATLPQALVPVDALLEDPTTGSLIAFNQGQDYVLTTTPASDRAFGLGCGAPAPRLVGVGRAAIGNADYRAQVRTDAGAPVLLAFGALPTAIALGGGCTQFVDGIAVGWFALADASGRADFGLPIPNAPAMRGQQTFAQAIAVQAGGPLGGLAVTPALAIAVGD